jgi:hypothetical protein
MKTPTLPAISNQATWSDTVELIDKDTGDPMDLGDVTEITLKLRDKDSGSTVLSGSLTGGEIATVGDDADGTFQFTFSASTMSAICSSKTYEIGILVTTVTETDQVVLGTIPVLEGL